MTQFGSGDDGRSLDGESSFFFGSNKFFKPSLTCFDAALPLEEEEEEDFEAEVVAVAGPDDGGAVVESGESIFTSRFVNRRFQRNSRCGSLFVPCVKTKVHRSLQRMMHGCSR